MGLVLGFHDETHRERVIASGVPTRLGAGGLPECGARTRSGAPCRQPPLSGFRRCQRHGGPATARAFRAEQIRDLAAGRITPEDFERHELRRAANRLRDRWKRDRWTPGRTIDLGEHEPRFRAELDKFLGLAVETISPATLDTARWKFRRLMLDRKRPGDWQAWVLDVLRPRIEADGPAPEGHDPRLSDAALVAFKVEGRPGAWSKRTRLDPPRRAAAAPAPAPKQTRRGRPPKTKPDDIETLRDHLAEHWPELRDLLRDRLDEDALCLTTARLHRARLSGGQRELFDWIAHVHELRAGGR